MRIPMAQIGHIAKSLRIPRFIIAWVKTSPITFEFSACRMEFCPPRYSIDRVSFLGISATVVVNDKSA